MVPIIIYESLFPSRRLYEMYYLKGISRKRVKEVLGCPKSFFRFIRK